MKKRVLMAAAALSLVSTTGSAQSAKFTAVWSDTAQLVRSEACHATNEADYCTDLNLGNTGQQVAKVMAEIKVPQSKELLVGVSAQIELFTETLAKGKKGTTSTAVAMAEGGVRLFACNSVCYEGQPGRVILSKRTQELEATLAGVIESCTVAVTVNPDSGIGSGSFNLSNCIVEEEAIRLALTTMAAHHFNFVFPNLPQGDYEVIARFDTDSSATSEVTCDTSVYDYCSTSDGSAGAAAYAVIGKHMITVQEVRAIKDEGGDPTEVVLP
jgi:hypothetical protein